MSEISNDKSKVITVKVSKGGVGKTTISSNLGYVFSQKGLRTLLIDLDSQANLSKVFIREFDEDKFTSSNLLAGEINNLTHAVYNINEHLDIITADVGLYEVSKYLESEGNYFEVLKKEFAKTGIFDIYDVVILDLSPGVSDIITEISLVASDLLICPTHFDIDSLTGLVYTINEISRLNEANLVSEDLNYLVVPNRYDRRFKHDNQVIFDMLYENLEQEFISKPIRENSHIKKSRMIGQSVIEYENDPSRAKEHNRAIEDFEELYEKVCNLIKIDINNQQ